MELEIEDLREKNREMVHLLQHWKVTAAQRENEKLELMKENNELRLKLGRLRSSISSVTNKYEAEFQSASEEAISFLVETSNRIARMLEIYRNYMQDRRELEAEIPRWTSLSNTPSRDKVNRVPPLLIDGRHIQPVVSLSRTLQTSNSRSINSMNSSTQSRTNSSERSMPVHILQDVFIPLTRIDAAIPINNAEVDVEDNMAEDSNDSSVRNMDESQNMSDDEDYDPTTALHTVPEDMEPEDLDTSQRSDNPLEGPSWLLDVPNAKHNPRPSVNLTPEPKGHLNVPNATPGSSRGNTQMTVACEFTPTVRRRKRNTSPPPVKSRSPHRQRRTSNNERILKVLVAKMRLDPEEENVEVTPPKRPNLDLLSPKPQKVFRRRAMESPKRQESSPMKRQEGSSVEHSMDGSPMCSVQSPSKRLMRFDAPSPNGSTDSRVIVLETVNDQPEPCCSGLAKPRTVSRTNSRDTYTIRNNRNHENINDTNNINHDIVPHSNRDNHNQQTNRDSQTQSNDNNNQLNSDRRNSGYVNDKCSSRPNRNRHDNDNHRHNDDEDNRNHASGDQDNRNHNGFNYNAERESDSSGSDVVCEGRTRRARKAVVYKEKPLNRKLRR